MMKHTARNITLILIGFILFQNALCQDTLLLDSSIKYFSDSDSIGIMNYYAKNIYYRADYARELIQFNSDSAKLESCFYYDNKRFCLDDRTYIFEIVKDSMIKVNFNGYSEIWRFEYERDSRYKLTRNFNSLKEIGYAKSIIPLEKTGDFFVIDMQGDTLWTTKYSKIVFPELLINEKPIIDSVYVICDSMPSYPGGLDNMRQDLMSNLWIDMPIIESYPVCGVIVISFVIDKQGEMKDIKILRSCYNGFVEKAVLIALFSLEKFTNGYMDNKPVNIRFTLPIHINLQ